MSVTSPPRRPSYQPSASDRRASSSTIGTTSAYAPDSGHDKKRRNRTLLRDYYGLGPTKGDPLDIDSPDSFNPNLYLHELTSRAGLPEMLRRETDLLNEIRELDGERQSLVYNHHHELIEASDTIRKMKSRAEALDASLDSLQTAFERISQLSTSLAAATPTTALPESLSGRSSSGTPRVETRPARTGSLASVAEARPPSSPRPEFSPLVHLAPLLSLPVLLRVLDRSKGDALWGAWEPALRSWEDERIEGVEQIGRECREVLRGSRRASVSVSGASMARGSTDG